MTCVTQTCNPDIGVPLTSSITINDRTAVIDSSCQDVLFLTKEDGNGLLSADSRTRVITSYAEAQRYFEAGGETLKAMADFFANTTREIKKYVKVGFIDAGEAPNAALDAIKLCDSCFLTVVAEHSLTDAEKLIAGQWCEANEYMFFFTSDDDLNLDPSSVSSPKAKHAMLNLEGNVMVYTKGQCDVVIDPATGNPELDVDGNVVTDTSIHYLDLLAAAYVSGQDLSQRNANYTIDSKPLNNAGWVGIKPEQLTASDVIAVSGSNTDGTAAQNNNGYGIVYARSSGIDGFRSGRTVTGAWVDQVHLKIYTRRKIRQAIATLMSQNKSVPYDDARGRNMIAGAIATELGRLQTSGLFTNDAVDWGKDYVRKGTGWVVRADTFSSQSPERQYQRVAPIFKACYVPAGSTQHVQIEMCISASTNA